jgi:hypothetical protein
MHWYVYMAGIYWFMRMLIVRKLPQTSEMHVKISEFADSWRCKLSGKFRNPHRNLPWILRELPDRTGWNNFRLIDSLVLRHPIICTEINRWPCNSVGPNRTRFNNRRKLFLLKFLAKNLILINDYLTLSYVKNKISSILFHQKSYHLYLK